MKFAILTCALLLATSQAFAAAPTCTMDSMQPLIDATAAINAKKAESTEALKASDQASIDLNNKMLEMGCDHSIQSYCANVVPLADELVELTNKSDPRGEMSKVSAQQLEILSKCLPAMN